MGHFHSDLHIHGNSTKSRRPSSPTYTMRRAEGTKTMCVSVDCCDLWKEGCWCGFFLWRKLVWGGGAESWESAERCQVCLSNKENRWPQKGMGSRLGIWNHSRLCCLGWFTMSGRKIRFLLSFFLPASWHIKCMALISSSWVCFLWRGWTLASESSSSSRTACSRKTATLPCPPQESFFPQETPFVWKRFFSIKP